ncbi:phage terminase small subunit [Brevundimonas nasdae]|uniref:phage terminase small subunit n=1 Tax=Brevundimonas nasdae TaxID=172043 RepID=UPI003F68C50D
MSMAQRVKARQAARETFDFEARRASLMEAEAARAAALAAGEAEPSPNASPAPHAVGAASPAQRHLQRKQALASAGAVVDGSGDLSPYDQMLVMLYQDVKRLQGIQDIDRKIDAKREILPNYSPWVLGRLEAAAQGQRGSQDDVLAQVMIWAIDVADYRLALELAEYCRRWSPVLPARFKRDLANTVTEEIADKALKAFRAGGEDAENFPAGVLGDVEELFRDDDMFSIVRAKLQKAIGLAILQALPEDADTAAKLPVWRDALAFFKRAQAKDASVGCVKLIEKLERDIAKAGD